MKSKSSAKRSPASKPEWKKAIARAPRRMDDSESPYDPNDREAVRAFWAKGKVRYPGGRGPQKSPTKTLVSLRLSRDVLAYFKATGPGWQTRIDEALKSAIETKSVESPPPAAGTTKRTHRRPQKRRVRVGQKY